MKKLILTALLTLLLCHSALGQYYIAPGGAVWPDGAVSYAAPVGAPFTARTHTWQTYPYSDYLISPYYWVAYPYTPVPMVQTPEPKVR